MNNKSIVRVETYGFTLCNRDVKGYSLRSFIEVLIGRWIYYEGKI